MRKTVLNITAIAGLVFLSACGAVQVNNTYIVDSVISATVDTTDNTITSQK